LHTQQKVNCAASHALQQGEQAVTEKKQARRRTGMSASEEKKAPSLAEVQAELESIIERLEDEGTGLEQSIELYEKGSQLLAAAGEVLADAEQRVRVLAERDTDGPPEEA
jgi:exodeoxyribonuclease VII small subunit